MLDLKYSTWTSVEKEHHRVELVTEYEELLAELNRIKQKLKDLDIEIITIEREIP